LNYFIIYENKYFVISVGVTARFVDYIY